MFSFESLQVPIVISPMAGGPSTPALVRAAVEAGGFGFLAGGDRSPEQLLVEIEEARAGGYPVGVNLMVPGDPALLTPERANAVERYREALRPWADRYGIELPPLDTTDQPAWRGKLEVLIEARVDVASSIFGCPTADEIAELREAGIAVGVTVTNVEDAIEAERRGADFLIVQGPLAGGHQGTWSMSAPVNQRSLDELLAAVRSRVNVPLLAAGGITTGADIRSMLNAGAVAVQMGTAFLRSDESGAAPMYKDALASGNYEETVPTRAFSGRVARAVANAFAREFTSIAPAAYGEVNNLTRAIRAASAAAGDPEGFSLYAGVGFAAAVEGGAGEIMARLWNDANQPTAQPLED